jgi:hypothetical protein
MTNAARNPNAESPPRDRTWLGLLALVLLLAASVWLVRKADATKPADWNESRLTYLPSGKLLKPFVMDLDEAAGDLLWINAMVYFADSYLQQKGYGWLGHMLDVVTTLNPHLYAAYEFSGVVLTKEKRELPKTIKLLDRGISVYPGDWKLRLYAAMAMLSLDSNYTKAAEYLEPITLAPEVPDHIRTLCATLLNKGGGQRVALAFLVDRYVRSGNAINREIFLKKILKLYPDAAGIESARMDTVSRVLHEVELEPRAELTGLGVIHEYLSGNPSPATKALLQALYK